MRPHDRIPIWENRRRRKLLIRFRLVLRQYFEGLAYFELSEPAAFPEATAARADINRLIPSVLPAVHRAGVSTTYTYAPPPAVGGPIMNVEVFNNIFGLHRLQVSSNIVTDCIDRALGVYEAGATRAWLRTFNPFYWVFEVIEYVARLPFLFLGQLGFDQAGLEHSVVGRTLKGVFYLVEIAAAPLTVLSLLGLLDSARLWLERYL